MVRPAEHAKNAKEEDGSTKDDTKKKPRMNADRRADDGDWSDIPMDGLWAAFGASREAIHDRKG